MRLTKCGFQENSKGIPNELQVDRKWIMPSNDQSQSKRVRGFTAKQTYTVPISDFEIQKVTYSNQKANHRQSSPMNHQIRINLLIAQL